jgi:hypothetical protein
VPPPSSPLPLAHPFQPILFTHRIHPLTLSSFPGFSEDPQSTQFSSFCGPRHFLKQCTYAVRTFGSRTGGMTQVVEHLPSRLKALSSNPSNTKKKKITSGCENSFTLEKREKGNFK